MQNDSLKSSDRFDFNLDLIVRERSRSLSFHRTAGKQNPEYTTRNLTRLRPDEFNFAEKCWINNQPFVHFNLQTCKNKVGQIYIIPRIKIKRPL